MLSSPTFLFFLGVPHADLGVLQPDLLQIRQTVVMILLNLEVKEYFGGFCTINTNWPDKDAPSCL